MVVVPILLLAGLLLAAGPAALVLVLASRRKLHRVEEENRRLADDLRRLESGALAPITSATSPVPAAGTPAPAAASEAPLPVPTPAGHPALPPKPAGDLETLVGAQWLTWLGVLTIFFGTAFFLAYDLGASALSGMGQILIGAGVGLAFILVGSRLTGRAQRFLGLGLLGGGVALFYLASYAAHGFHDLVPARVVYPFLLGVSGVGAGLALRHDAAVVAGLTLIGALATPLVLGGDRDPGGVLFPYLFAVNLGTVAVATRRRWPPLPLGAFHGTVFLIALWWWRHDVAGLRLLVLPGIGAQWLLYLVYPLLRPARAIPWRLTDGLVVLDNGIAFGIATTMLLEPDLTRFQGAVLGGLALVYLGLARGLRSRSAASRMIHYTGIVLVAVAAPVQFHAGVVTLTWALLAFLLTLAGVRGASLPHRVLGLALAGLAALKLTTLDTVDLLDGGFPRRPVINPDFWTAIGVVGVLLGAAHLYRGAAAVAVAGARRIMTALVLAAAFLFGWRISTECIAYFSGVETSLGEPGAKRLAMLLTLSLVWVLYAGSLIWAGFATRYRPVRTFAVGLLGVLVLKMFFMDLSLLSKGYRIASFAGVGVLLLAISLLYQRERRASP